MPSKKNAHKRSLKTYAAQDHKILGLDAFRLKIEKEFFCDIKVTNSRGLKGSINLVLEAKFNFELSQGLSLLSNRKIGDLDLNLNIEKDCSFLTALQGLREKNVQPIDIVELNIVFLETTLIIHKIFENSIASQLKNLIDELYSNYIYFSKGLTHIPYEVHIPVFEERPFDSNYTLLNKRMNANKGEDYFAFWGLYFEDRVDADIYDFFNKDIIDGELTMIDQ